MSIDSHLITNFTHVNLPLEIEEGKILLENQEFKISIFHFYFLNTDISVGILYIYTYENFKTYRKHSVVVNCVSEL